ncbi:hypothetical protein C6P97_17755 [Burkholderia multivorans]|uniref:Uncharacterized protein n=1 Tax=Burkholderia multivorans TaxID=87883 RepID=A0AB37AQS8_9BURK|nr:hypothetical protein C6P99_19955 [Burkholderia multivorans]PRE47229.1 hypothetical protein C6P97_17755 [Burkholderia multivorans]
MLFFGSQCTHVVGMCREKHSVFNKALIVGRCRASQLHHFLRGQFKEARYLLYRARPCLVTWIVFDTTYFVFVYVEMLG